MDIECKQTTYLFREFYFLIYVFLSSLKFFFLYITPSLPGDEGMNSNVGVIMVCFNPYNAFLPFNEDISGKRRLIFSEKLCNELVLKSNIGKRIAFDYNSFLFKESGYNDGRIIVASDFYSSGELSGVITRIPCGKCIGCRNDNARRWSARCYNEAQSVGLHNCCFVTLTFNNKMLFQRTNPYSLDKLAFSGFLKRFRKRISDKYGISGVRFFSCGEYGSLKGRPHYHMLIFGFNFPDKKVMKGPNYPKKLQPHRIKDRIIYNYSSEFLNECWSPAGSSETFGFATISDLTYEDCAYTARYVMKKLGQLNSYRNRESEFINSSRMPGLGYDFFRRYYKNILSVGYIDLGNGRCSDIPRYYIDKLKEFDLEYYERFKLDRMNNIIYNLFIDEKNPTRQRLLAQEEVLKQKLDKYVRQYEFEADLHNIYYRYISYCYKNRLKRYNLRDIIFELKNEDARKTILQDDNKYNLIFLDAFTPSKCPCLWSYDFFKELYNHLEQDGLILTYSSAASVRAAMMEANLYIGNIYNERENKFMGTVASKDKSLIKYPLSEFDLGLLKTRAGIFYRDENLTALNEAINERRNFDVKNSTRISSSQYQKLYKEEQCTTM